MENDTINAPHTYTLSPAEYMATRTKIAKINARAEKRGFTGRIILDAKKVISTREVAAGLEVSEVVYETTITGEAPSYNGWTLAAVLTWDEFAGLVTRTAPGVDKIDRTNLQEKFCDHCGINRPRNQTYLVINDETGETKQVGSTCIKDFLGWEGRVVWLGEDDIEREIDAGGFGGGERSWTVESVLAIAWALIKLNGFVPASQVGATRDGVVAVLDPLNTTKAKEFAREIRVLSENMYEKANEVRDFILSDVFRGDSEYVVNLKAIVGGESVTWKNLGFLASAPQAMAKAQARDLIRKEKESNPSEWFGQEKERVTFTGTIETINYSYNQFGTTVIYTIRNAEDGRIVKWFASKEALGDKTGITVTIQGTVKNHEEWNGIKSTVLTRCKKIGE